MWIELLKFGLMYCRHDIGFKLGATTQWAPLNAGWPTIIP